MTAPSPFPKPLPLAFGNHRAREDHDPDQLAQLVSRAVPLRDLSPRLSPTPFVHRSVHVQAGSLGITAAAHSPLHGTNHSHNKSVFTLPTLGEKRFLINGRIHRARAGYCALFLPGEAYSLDTSYCSGVMFSLCPQELATVASVMAGPQSGQSFAPIQRPLELLESHPQQGKMLSLLRRSLQLIDLAILNGPSVPKQLGLDDKLQRLIALLIYPQLSATPVSGAGEIGKAELAAFEHLLIAIQQDLLGNWTLTRMGLQAALSRHQLQQLFQSAFSCGPREWLRHQRLCWARHRLDSSDPITLQQLALQCGYLDETSFRKDFESQFLLAPESIQPNLCF
jgi:AraC-like DNA-binding protein